MKYDSYKDIPTIVQTESGDKFLIHGYFQQAKVEAVDKEQERIATRLLNAAVKEAIELKGSRWVNDWVAHANEAMNAPRLKET